MLVINVPSLVSILNDSFTVSYDSSLLRDTLMIIFNDLMTRIKSFKWFWVRRAETKKDLIYLHL